MATGEEKRACSVLGCDEDGDSEKTRFFYVFPTDFDVCMKWVQNIARSDYFEEFVFAGALPFTNKYVCCRHFAPEDFIDPQDPSAGLKPQVCPINYQNEDDKTEPLLESVKEEPLDFPDNTSATDLLNNEYESPESSLSGTDKCELIKYKNRVRTQIRRERETDEQREKRLRQDALRASLRRIFESEEQAKERKMRNALRASCRRMNETPEKREERRFKDRVRSKQKRQFESEEESKIRKYNDAVRAAFRRSNESDEQRRERLQKDIARAAKKRSMESPDERELRLRKDRERALKRRTLKKIYNEVGHFMLNLPDVSGINCGETSQEAEECLSPKESTWT